MHFVLRDRSKIIIEIEDEIRGRGHEGIPGTSSWLSRSLPPTPTPQYPVLLPIKTKADEQAQHDPTNGFIPLVGMPKRKRNRSPH